MAIYTIEQFRSDMVKAHTDYVGRLSAATDEYMRETSLLMERSRDLPPEEVLPVVEAMKGLTQRPKSKLE